MLHDKWQSLFKKVCFISVTIMNVCHKTVRIRLLLSQVFRSTIIYHGEMTMLEIQRKTPSPSPDAQITYTPGSRTVKHRTEYFVRDRRSITPRFIHPAAYHTERQMENENRQRMNRMMFDGAMRVPFTDSERSEAPP
jgi:hypothetical protein